MRIRTVKPEFWTDEKTGQMAVESALVFLALINLADDKGRLRGDARMIRGQLFPYRTKLNVEGAIEDCVRLGLLQRYVVRDQAYLWIVNFNKHQRINRPSPSLIPAPPDTLEVNSLNTHGGLTEDSLNTHGALTEDSLRTHGALTEDSLRERKGKERKGNIYSVADATSGTDSKEKALKSEKTEESLKTTVKAFQDAYNAKVGATLPQWSKVSHKRNAALKTWLQSRTLEDWSNLLEIVKTRPFLLGQNDRGWKADALFLLKVENAIKIEEGGYTSRSPVSQQLTAPKPKPKSTAEMLEESVKNAPTFKPLKERDPELWAKNEKWKAHQQEMERQREERLREYEKLQLEKLRQSEQEKLANTDLEWEASLAKGEK